MKRRFEMSRLLTLGALYLLSSLAFADAATLDSLLKKTYDQMHNDCMSETYIDDELIITAFVEMDTLKTMELLKDRNMVAFARKYIDPELIEEKRKKLQKKYDKLNKYMDLKGRGFLFEDMSNAYVASRLLGYRYMYLGAANYGLVPEKSWTSINANAWRLVFRFGKKEESFYFRRIGAGWFLTGKKFIK